MAAKTCLKTTGAIILLLVLVVTSAAVQAEIIYIDIDATGNDDGTSWTDAYNDLQDALVDDAVSGDEIWVAKGTYKPTPTSSRFISFVLVDGVAIYGGFDPTIGDDTWAERDYTNNVTILSGDIGTVDVHTDNSYHVVVCIECGASTVLDGFTITRGYANGSSLNDNGGGMYNAVSSHTVINCIFTDNYAEYAGGMFNNTSAFTTVENCTFVANSAANWGAAIATTTQAGVTVKNCLFFMNSMSKTDGCFGGAIFNYDGATELTNCTFVGNVAGGGIAGYGGALTTSYAWNTVTNCIFWGNWAITAGGEIYVNEQSALTISYCDIEGGWNGSKVYDPLDVITNGGGNIDSDPCFINIFDFSDITVAAGDINTIKVNDASRYTVNDEIEYDNDGVARKVTDVNTTNDIITFANDALDANSVMGKVIFNWGSGATDVDEDFHLHWDSNCINTGDPDGDYTGQTDIDGQPRVMVTEVDMGADEAAYMPICHPDYNEWVSVGEPACWCYQRQCHGDADSVLEGDPKGGYFYVGVADLDLLLDAWKVKEPPDGPGIGSVENGICADFDHQQEGDPKGGYFRVGAGDLAILQEYWKILEPPDGNGVDPNCLECE